MIKIYGRQGCSRCKIICDYLNNKKIDFYYYDVDELSDEENVNFMDITQKNNIFSLPVIIYNGDIIKDIKEIIK